MSLRLRPYPEYRDSGIPWLGAVPEHWDVRRSKYILREIDDRTPDGREQLLSVSQQTGVTPRRPRDGGEEPGTRAASLVGYKRVSPGDLAVNIMLAWNGSLGVARDPGIVSPAYCVYRFRDHIDPWYYHSLLRLPAYRERIRSVSTGVVESRLRLYSDDLYCVEALLPPAEEQEHIARFVDASDGRINRLIRAKRRMIELLNEQKQAIIHRAVTRGLDPNVRLKPSGVDWLGNVPDHWEVVALRHRYSQCLGKMLDSKRITGNHSLPYLRNTDVQWDRINIKDLPTMDIPQTEYDRYNVQKGDLLVCEGGEIARCAIWSGELAVCGFQKALHRLRPRNAGRDVPRFMYYALRAAAKGNAFNDGHLSTIAHLTGDKLRAHRFPFPPMTEQESLVSLLDSALKQVDQAVFTAAREIALLREYRTRLIADVVIGKLDVRAAAARLTDEGDEPEPLDDAEALAEGNEETEGADFDAVPEEAEA